MKPSQGLIVDSWAGAAVPRSHGEGGSGCGGLRTAGSRHEIGEPLTGVSPTSLVLLGAFPSRRRRRTAMHLVSITERQK